MMNCGTVHDSLRAGLHASFRANSFHREKELEKNSLSFHAGALHFSRLDSYMPIPSLRTTYMVESVYPLFRPFNSV